MYKRVLLPVSGENRGQRAHIALKKALQVCDGIIILLHVTEPIPQTVGGENRQELERENRAQGMLVVTPIIEQLENAKVHFRTCIEAGTVAETIVRIADEEKADLIVMFTDGREDLKDFLLGSTTERVLRNTGTDLLAVRRED
ncbi:MAG: universal stress protein [Desulfovibrio sp.]|nr:universal stress protein [Desulfovibrio sp.]